MGIKDIAKLLFKQRPQIVDVKLKFVLYGPDGAGKSTFLRMLHESFDTAQKGELTRLVCDDGSGEETTFFDATPTELNARYARDGFQFSFAIYEAKGPESKRLILNGVNGIIFVADSRADAHVSNAKALHELESNLSHFGWTLDAIPWVIVYNKSDLADAGEIFKLGLSLNKWNVPLYKSTTEDSLSVLEPFELLLTDAVENFDYDSVVLI